MESSGTEQEQGFAPALEASIERLQRALREAFATLGVERFGPTAIAASLGLDKSMAWKIGRIAKAREALEAFEFLPGAPGVRLVVEAFGAAGLGTAKCDELTAAFGEVRSGIARHAPDRGTARVMARAASSVRGRAELDENLRRDHFRTSSAIWGAQARVQLKTDLLAPARRANRFDTAGIEGFVDLVRLRPGVKWPIGRRRSVKTQSLHPAVFKALEPQPPGGAQPPLLRDFCSQPLPKVKTERSEDGFSTYFLQPGDVGKTAATTCLIGTSARSIIELDEPDETVNLFIGPHVRTPVELLAHDVFVHRSILGRGSVKATLYGQLAMGAAFPATGKDQPLPVPLRAVELGDTPGDWEVAGVERYADTVLHAFELAARAFGKKRWQREDFVGFRVLLTYPPIPSFASTTVPLRAPR